ncbi:hypothetical protein [Palleronia abyssalis]|uniref:Uncharacterized protein n=1 Tax=Palleronia abyssalis TaxID=1501240 RepID=A0A2R8BWW6_9RHOB|nr:hypothetical protein [Palleronia abyssalis]SPJ24645.1 hypothetical protein PAA8504_02482 [Palleronia abyssalis]
MNHKQLEDLADIAGVISDRELSKVRVIMAEMARLRSEIAEIQDQRAARQADAALDLARVSGAEMAWMAATEERLRVLQSQHARLRAGHEQVLDVARKAFGRADVARRLAEGAGKRR